MDAEQGSAGNGDLWRRVAELEAEVADLRIALETRDAISMAKGILMANGHVTSEQAFEWLRRASQRQNRKLREVAADIVARYDRGGARAIASEERRRARQSALDGAAATHAKAAVFHKDAAAFFTQRGRLDAADREVRLAERNADAADAVLRRQVEPPDPAALGL